MDLLVFPTSFPNPVVPETEASSYKEDFKDSTVSSTTDANYTITRPRGTRLPGAWTYLWRGVSAADYQNLINFWNSVNGTAGMFLWTPWFSQIRTAQTTVRFTAKGDWQLYSEGYRGTLSFEEV
jgi:hypothetical protein